MFLLSILSLSRNANRACLHGDGGPQVGEVTRLGGVTRLPIKFLIWSRTYYVNVIKFKREIIWTGATKVCSSLTLLTPTILFSGP